jgi:hypothetical protein
MRESLMTREEAIAKILVETPFPSADLEGFLACTDAERVLIIQTYATANVMDYSAWKVFLAILAECEALVNLVIPIESAVQGVFNIVQAVK